ncbi:hypothetical protein NX781_05425 [Lactobacillus kullabergensis]|uniref:hypothetical protein n=1 Tax=Lactobacillus kullabergensis TaxID=1218493 RepID=UPI00224560EC|nr:hypothetical protein [Lactobacillus kullabergensis]MCX0291229.1 hypothetical protein [Lactobacillus kullabergensis]
MKNTVIVLLLFAVFILSWFSENKLRKRLFSELLSFERKGQKSKYFQLLEAPVAKICLSARSRELLQLDYFLTYGDIANVKKIVSKFIKKPSDLAKNNNLLIRLMRSYMLFLEKSDQESVYELENYLKANCKTVEIEKEIDQLHRVYLAPDQNLLTELNNQLNVANEPQQRLIIYERLVKASELLGLNKQAKEYLLQMKEVANKTIKLEEF